MWRPHLIFLGSRLDARWQEVWPRHENNSRERCGSRASSPYLLFTIGDSAVACFFSLLSCSGYSIGPSCQLWHAASEPCQAHLHLPK